MKHFRVVSISIFAAILILFVADICFMVSLYNSIKQRYLSDVEQCLLRADLIEMIARIDKAGLAGNDGIVEVWTGLQRSDIGAASTPEELHEINYSQGYKRLDRQLISIITKYLHDSYDDKIPPPDVELLEEAFRRELNFSGFFPEEVIVLAEDATIEYSESLWELEQRVDGELVYTAFISPLTKNIMQEMSGIIVVTALLAIILAFAFWYLIHIISRQRTIEEMKDDFTNNMTHELKTPIAIAYAANDALLQFPDTNDEVRTKKYLNAALQQLSKLSGLVENILGMSMERRKNLVINKEPIMLRPFIQSIIEQQEIKVTKLHHFNLTCDVGAVVDAEPVHFSNILNNLIDNCVKYSGEQVSISINADSRHISISDNGIGIPQKYIDHIFEKFFRVPTGNNAQIRGYGIGLFYVKSLVDKHGWSIAVESKEGQGTAFTIKF